MKNKGTIKRLLTYTKPYAPLIALSFVCAAAYVAMTLAVPVAIGGAVDKIAEAGRVDFNALPPYILTLAAAAAGAAVMQWRLLPFGESRQPRCHCRSDRQR